MNMPLDRRTQISDETLLAAFARGDRAAARDLTIRLTPRVHALAFRMLRDRDEAEDIAQEAMLRLWKYAPKWESGGAKVSTWLHRVTFNLCTDRLRKKRPDQFEEGFEPADAAKGQEEAMIEDARMDALGVALAELPDRQREAVVLRHLEGLSNPEIAETMEIGVEAVESLTARGKRKLKDLLSKHKKSLGYMD